MSVSFNPGVNPDEYAKTYATENNMSVDDAKIALREKYGEPQKPQDVSVFDEVNNVDGTDDENSLANIDPNFVAQMYSELNGLTLDEAIAELEEKLGIPSETGLTDTIKNFIQNIINSITGKEEKVPDQGIDPDAYAQQYADENGLTLDEAKAELKEKMGDPEKPEEGATEATAKPDPGVDPDTYAQQYADEKGITLDEAKAELKEKYGDPVQPEEKTDEKGGKPKFDVNQDPDYFVRLYAIENDITYEEAKAYFQSQYGNFE